MSINDAYAAGFFDGEGTIYSASRNNSKSPTIIVCITNTVAAPLEAMQAKWGGSIYLNKSPGGRRRPQYQWTLCSRMAKPFLQAIRPYLMIKHEVVDLAIQHRTLMELPHRERVDYSNTVQRAGRLRTAPIMKPEFRAKIDDIQNQIRALNIRGAPMNARRQHSSASAL